MLISEMIAQLEELKEKHGDIEIWEGCDRCPGGPMNDWYTAKCIGGPERLFLTHECEG